MFKRMIGAAAFLITIGGVGGLWAYFELAAPVVPGTIIDKQERIIGGRHAAPGRYLATSFTLVNETEEDRYLYGSPLTTDIQVDPQTYAAHAVGAMVRVKYLPFNPRFARLAGQPLVPQALWMIAAALATAAFALLVKRTRQLAALSTLTTAAVLYSTPGPPSPRLALAAAVALTVIGVVAAIVRRASARALLFAWAVATAAIFTWPAVPGATASPATARAEIRSVTEFLTAKTTRARTTFTLQEFDRVHAAFVPQGATRPVFLLDFVDHGSGGGRAEGAMVAVEYDRGNPDAARLVQGRRTHYWKNAAIPVGAALAAAWLATRKPKARQKSSKAQPA